MSSHICIALILLSSYMLIFNLTVVRNFTLVIHHTLTALSHGEQGHPNRDATPFSLTNH
jgi:hypothetical protein